MIPNATLHDLGDRSVLITGGGSGIDAALIQCFPEHLTTAYFVNGALPFPQRTPVAR